MLAYDLDSRAEKWRINPAKSKCDADSNPIPGGTPTISDGTLYYGIGKTIYALDIEDGSIRWSFDGIDPELSGGTVEDGTVYFGEGHRENAFYAVDADDGTLKWSHKAEYESADECVPSVADGVVYAPYDEYLVALNAETGERLWRYEYGYQAGNSLAVTDD